MRWKWSRMLGLSLSSALAVSCSQGSDASTPGQDGADSVATQDETDEDADAVLSASKVSAKLKARPKMASQFATTLRASLDRGESRDVIVEFAKVRSGGSVRQRKMARGAAARLNESLLRGLHKELVVKRAYQKFPLAVVRVQSAEALDRMIARGEILAVHEVQTFRAMTPAPGNAVSVTADYIGASNFAAELTYPDAESARANLGSYDVEGVQTPVGIALLDGTVDVSAFGCEAAGDEGCPIVLAPEVGEASAHATAMASILHAVAPKAAIYNYNIEDGEEAGVADSTRLLDALEALDENVKVVSLSFGTEETYDAEACAEIVSPLASAIDALEGVVVLAASGNGGSTTGMSFPACLPSVTSVGAVQGVAFEPGDSAVLLPINATETCSQSSVESDAVLCNTNVGVGLDLLAPGLAVVANGQPAQSGTSVATAHAAAAVAATFAAHQNEVDDEAETVQRAVSRLIAAGVPVAASADVVASRVALADSQADCVGPYVKSTDVELTSAGVNEDGVIEVETDATCAMDLTKPTWATVVDPDDGAINLDISGSTNTAGIERSGQVAAYGLTFNVTQKGDDVAPAVASVTASASSTYPSDAGYVSNRLALLTISAADESGGSGLTHMCISSSLTETPCQGSSWLAFAATRTHTFEGTADGSRNLTVWVKDKNGNVSAPYTTSFVIDSTEPVMGTMTTTRTVSPVGATFAPSSITEVNRKGYKLTWREGATAPAARCIVSGDTQTMNVADGETPALTGLTVGKTYTARLCAYDSAGNAAVGLTSTFVATNDMTAPALVQSPEGTDANALGIAYVPAMGAAASLSYSDGNTGNEVLGTVTGLKLRLTASDNLGITGYCLSTLPTCTAWTTVASATALNQLVDVTGTTNGVRTYYVKFRDAAGNESAQTSTSALLDSIAPSQSTLTATLGAGSVSLRVAGLADAGSGVTSLVIARTESSTATLPTAPANCSGGSVVPVGAIVSGVATYVDSTVVGGTNYAYRVCARDSIGNTSAGATVSAKATSDTTKPTGDLVLTSSDTPVIPGYAKTRTVTYAITAADLKGGVANTVDPMVCVSTNPLDASTTCPGTAATGVVNAGWKTVTGGMLSGSLTLTTGDGAKNYYVKFKDDAASPNNVTAPITRTIRLDTLNPVAGTVTGTPKANFVSTLSWAGFTDANPLTYTILRGTSLALACTGTVLQENATSPFTLTGVTAAETRHYCVKATDKTGRSAQKAASVNFRSEVTAPTLAAAEIAPSAECSVANQCLVVGTKKFTRKLNPNVKITLSDTNRTGGAVCVSSSNNATTCTGWRTLETDNIYTPFNSLAAGNAVRTYYFFGRDGLGNVTPTAKTATINVDTVGPSGGLLTPTASSQTAISVNWTKPTDTGGVGLPASSIYTLCFVAGTTRATSTTIPECNATMTGCTKGTKLNIPTAGSTVSFSHTGLVKNTYYNYALCRKDALGNFTTLRKAIKTKP